MYRALQVQTEFMGLYSGFIGLWALHDATIAVRQATRTKEKTVRNTLVLDSSRNTKYRHRSQVKATIPAVEMLTRVLTNAGHEKPTTELSGLGQPFGGLRRYKNCDSAHMPRASPLTNEEADVTRVFRV